MIRKFEIKYNKHVFAWQFKLVESGLDNPIKYELSDYMLGNLSGYNRRKEYVVLDPMFDWIKASLEAEGIEYKQWYQDNYDLIGEIYILVRDWVAQPKDIIKEFVNQQ